MAFTGTELIAKVRWAGDYQGNTARHTDADILAAINQSIAQYRRMLSDLDLSNYATFTTISTASNVSVVSAPAMEQVLGVQITLNQVTSTMHRAANMEQTQYRIAGRPATWMLRDRPGSSGVMDVQLFPTPDAVYTINLQYIPTPTAITTATSFYAEVAGGEEWVVYDVATKLAVRDNHPRAGALAAERDAQALRLRQLALRQREPGHRMDTRGQRRVNDLLARRRA